MTLGTVLAVERRGSSLPRALVTFALLAPSSALPLAAQDTIKAIEIVRHDVFSGDVAHTFYGRLANTLHIMTRDGAIRRGRTGLLWIAAP